MTKRNFKKSTTLLFVALMVSLASLFFIQGVEAWYNDGPSIYIDLPGNSEPTPTPTPTPGPNANLKNVTFALNSEWGPLGGPPTDEDMQILQEHFINDTQDVLNHLNGNLFCQEDDSLFTYQESDTPPEEDPGNNWIYWADPETWNSTGDQDIDCFPEEEESSCFLDDTMVALTVIIGEQDGPQPPAGDWLYHIVFNKNKDFAPSDTYCFGDWCYPNAAGSHWKYRSILYHELGHVVDLEHLITNNEFDPLFLSIMNLDQVGQIQIDALLARSPVDPIPNIPPSEWVSPISQDFAQAQTYLGCGGAN